MNPRKIATILACALVLLPVRAPQAAVAADAVRKEIAGIDVTVIPTGARDVVTLAGSLPAGDDRSPPDNVAVATLAGEMLDQGTTRRDKFAIAEALADAGAALGFGVDAHSLSISGKCLRKDVPLLVTLLAEQLRAPAFAEEEFRKQQKQLEGGIRRQLETTDFRASDAFSRAVFPVGHPNRQAEPEELLAAIGRTTVADLRRFHERFYGPAGMRLVIVGDVDPAVVQAEIERAFAGWTGGVARAGTARAGRLAGPREVAVPMPDKASVSVTWGQATQLRYADPGALALRVATSIFGSGFTGRLMANVRDREGLTYGIGSFVGNDSFADGDWRIQGDFAPNLLAQGIESTRRQLTEWYERGVTEEELARAKTRLAGSYAVGLATTSGLAGQVLATLNRGLPLAFVDEYPQRIAALTLDEVNAAIRRHLDPSQMVLVRAGTLPPN